jgi:acetyl esterase/lipase
VALVAISVAASMLLSGAPARAATRYVDVVFDDIVKTSDIVYGSAVNSNGVGEQLALDVYEPAGDTLEQRPVYVWAHGGSFKNGDKDSVGPILDYVRRGWVAMSIDYRLRPEMPAGYMGILTSPDPVAATQVRLDAARDAQHDMQAAVRWARANAVTYGLDPGRIAVGGFSAGAETALLVGFNEHDPGASGNPAYSSAVAAAVSHAGVMAPVLQGSVDPGDPPIAILHGTDDLTVPYASAYLPCLATLAVLNTCEVYSFTGREHGVFGEDLAADFLYRHVIRGRTNPMASAYVYPEGDPTTMPTTAIAAVESGIGFGIRLGVVYQP